MVSRERKTQIEEDPRVRQDFGMELRLLRVIHGKTQAEWAEVVGIDPSAISALESVRKRQILPRPAVIE